MKALKIWLLIITMIILAGSAWAVTVTVNINGQPSQTYNLTDMSIDSSGNITLNVSPSASPSPDPLVLTLTPPTLPTGTVGQSYNQTVIMSATGGTPPFSPATYTYSCSTVNNLGITASNSGDICSISGTPTSSGVVTVNFSVTDSSNQTASKTISFNITSSTTPPPGNYIDITTTGHLPNYLKGQSVAPYDTAKGAGAAYYGFKTSKSYNKISVNLEAEIDATGDYTADMDLIISNQRQPLCSDIVRGSYSKGTNGLWYGSGINRSNETIVVTNRDDSGRLQPIPTGTWYVTICNFTPGVTGKFRISWAGYY